MKAIVFERYGGPEVFTLREIAKPVPKDNEVLVKVRAASLNALDWRMMRGIPFLVRLQLGLSKPKTTVPGADLAGVVEAVGRKVKQFQPGDEVFGDISEIGFGAFAEYVCTPEKLLVKKPSQMTFEEASALPVAGITALQGCRDFGKIQPGQHVLINGASGGVGSFAVQIAKLLGAEVTAVCSTRKTDFVKSLGADHVIDYTKEDFTQNGRKYDMIFAANGYHPIRDYKKALRPQGTYRMAGGTTKQIFEALLLGPILSRRKGKKLGTVRAKSSPEDLHLLSEYVENGQLKPVIDKTYSLETFPEAMRYLEEERAWGKVVITV